MTDPREAAIEAALLAHATVFNLTNNTGKAIRAAIEAYEDALWHSIKTAPHAKEKIDVLLTGGHLGKRVELKPSDGEWWARSDLKWLPTHWRLVPTPPKGGADDK